jgi:hypothetical protein
MHVDFTISLGQIGMLIGFVALIWRIEVFSAWLMLEHEMLIEWYCQQHNVRPNDLMSRKLRRGILGIMKGTD